MATWGEVRKNKLTQSDWLLIIANLFPVYGVWFLQWNAKEVFLVYCFETILIGFFTLLKMGTTGVIKKRDEWHNQGSVTQQSFIFFMLFFLVHYGMFVSIQMGIFFSVSGIGQQSGITFSNFFYKWPEFVNQDILLMLAVFFVSYAFRNLNEFVLTGEYKTASLSYLMFQPYGRIFIQQFTVIIGSIFLSFGAGQIFVLVFAIIKILFEVMIDFESILKKAAKGELK
jgi:hypothetical protein